MKQISIWLIDDNTEYLRLIIKMVLKDPEFKINGVVSHKEFTQLTLAALPEIVFISYRESKPQTWENIKNIKEKHPEIKVLISASMHDKVPVEKFKELKIEGMIYKQDADPTELVNALRVIYNNRTYYGA